MNTYVCKVCGKEFKRYKSQVRKPDRVTCSPKCRFELQKTEGKWSGIKNPKYKDGHTLDTTCPLCYSKKDSRAQFCAVCAKTSFPIDSPRVTLDQIKQAVSSSKTFLEISNKLKVSRHYIRKICKENSIDTTHFSKCATRPYTFEEVFWDRTGVESVRSSITKNYILKNNLLPKICSECGCPPEWNNKPLTLELDHIDGNPLNDTFENLRFLCPNCHTQQETSRGKKTTFMKNKNKEKIRGDKP